MLPFPVFKNWSERYQHHKKSNAINNNTIFAVDNQTNKKVVVKFQNKFQLFRINDDSIDREVQILRYIQHELQKSDQKSGGYFQCAELIDYFQDDMHKYIVTSYVSGGDMFTRVRSTYEKGRRFKQSLCQKWFYQMVCCVDWLHKHHIAFIDIALENVCIDENKNIVIIDFGLAAINLPHIPIDSFLNEQHYSAIQWNVSIMSLDRDPKKFPCIPIKTNSYCKPGRTTYMCPELYNDEPWDAYEKDVFSLGVFLFILCTGVPMFEKPSIKDDKWYNFFISGDWLKNKREYFCHLTKPVMTLIHQIVSERINLDAIFKHEWLAGQEISK